MRRLALLACLVGLLVATPQTGSGSTRPTASDPPATLIERLTTIEASDPAVQYLAADQHIPIPEAQQRIWWQTRIGPLETAIRPALGDRFGGIWIDPADGNRIKVGVVGGTVDLRRWTARLGIDKATDVVPVRHSLADLEAAWDDLNADIKRAAKPGAARLQPVLLTNHNAVGLRAPRGQRLTSDQRALVTDAQRRYGAALRISSYQPSTIRKQACTLPSSGVRCDPPLRGGVTIDSSTGVKCTTGFYTQSKTDTKKFILTAGHCVEAAPTATWYAFNYPGVGHTVGPSHRFPTRGTVDADVGTIQITGGSYWTPMHWVYLASTPDVPYYYIINDQKAGLGDTVCLTGSRGAPRWGTDCGTVRMLQAGGKYKVMAKDICATYGDSGGPYFAGHVAYGIHEGGTIDCDPLPTGHEQYFTDIEAAETLMNVNVIHGG
jgi:streptogrisin C